MYQISKEEAEYVRARTKNVHIRVCGKFHVARDKTYYIDESPLARKLIEEFWAGKVVVPLEVGR